MDSYVAAKTPVVLEVLGSSGHFTPDELDAIAALNEAPSAG
jgi:hypothetical protein